MYIMCLFKRKKNNVLAEYDPYALTNVTYDKNGLVQMNFESKRKIKKRGFFKQLKYYLKYL